jgi:hypothetical protein
MWSTRLELARHRPRRVGGSKATALIPLDDSTRGHIETLRPTRGRAFRALGGRLLWCGEAVVGSVLAAAWRPDVRSYVG